MYGRSGRGVGAQFRQDLFLGARVQVARARPRRVRAREQVRLARVADTREIDADVLIGAGRSGARDLRADAGVGERCLLSDSRDLATELDDFGACLEHAEGDFGGVNRRVGDGGVA